MYFFETVFKTTNHPQKPHGHKMKRFWSLVCGAVKHSPRERLSFSLHFWGRQNIHGIPDVELARTQFKYTSPGLSFKRNDFPQGDPYSFETNLI